MSAKLTIILRGLMVFRLHGEEGKPGSRFEVGILPVTHDHPPGHVRHYLRINTYKNGVLDEIKLFEDKPLPSNRIWRLDVAKPVTPGVRRDMKGAKFTRLEPHPYPRDYRWLMDFENKDEFYDPLKKGDLDTTGLLPVLHIPNGLFYTRLKSRKQTRQKNNAGPFDPFGEVAVAIGCDIELNGSEAVLLEEATGTKHFTFTVDTDPAVSTIYEIANTPSDTHVFTKGEEHFKHYYDLFKIDVPKYKFETATLSPGPSPALCGKIQLSKFPEPL